MGKVVQMGFEIISLFEVWAIIQDRPLMTLVRCPITQLFLSPLYWLTDAIKTFKVQVLVHEQFSSHRVL